MWTYLRELWQPSQPRQVAAMRLWPCFQRVFPGSWVRGLPEATAGNLLSLLQVVVSLRIKTHQSYTIFIRINVVNKFSFMILLFKVFQSGVCIAVQSLA